MQNMLEDLSLLLAEEYRTYERLFEATATEQQCLVGGDTNLLDHSLMEVRALISKVQAVAERRTLIVCRIAEHTGIPVGELTLARLGQMARGTVGMRLERLGKDFRELMTRLHKFNGTNLLLIRNSLDMNDRAARLILGETGQVQFYGESGRAADAHGPRVLSRRI